MDQRLENEPMSRDSSSALTTASDVGTATGGAISSMQGSSLVATRPSAWLGDHYGDAVLLSLAVAEPTGDVKCPSPLALSNHLYLTIFSVFLPDVDLVKLVLPE